MRSLHAMLLGGVDPFEADDRHCVPDDIDVQATLSESMLADLPKAMSQVKAPAGATKQSKATSS